MNFPKATSIRQRLLNRSKETHENYNLLLGRYMCLRFLARLATSPYRDRFLLKGATLFLIWQGNAPRPTRDIDLLGFHLRDESEVEQIFTEICTQQIEDDGVEFDSTTIKIERIRKDNLYGGVRCTIVARLGTAKQVIQIDIGFGDSVDPQPELVEVPRLLPEETAVTMNAYRPETAISEKLDAMVTNGIDNSRMKDFFDIDLLSRKMEFDGTVLSNAIRRTFERRRTSMYESIPVALTETFWAEPLVVQRLLPRGL